MSTRKGATLRNRPQKHQNRTAFKNDLHDKSVKIKFINNVQVSGVCTRCKEIIEWKITYKKYKPLSAPKKCVRCDEKAIKQAYHVLCQPCAKKEEVCAKCCKKHEIIVAPVVTTPKEDSEFQDILKSLPERKRRTLLRFIQKNSQKPKQENSEDEPTNQDESNEIAEKIRKLKLCCRNKEDLDKFDFGSEEELHFTDESEDEPL